MVVRLNRHVLDMHETVILKISKDSKKGMRERIEKIKVISVLQE